MQFHFDTHTHTKSQVVDDELERRVLNIQTKAPCSKLVAEGRVGGREWVGQ